jgi:hypothetical protein
MPSRHLLSCSSRTCTVLCASNTSSLLKSESTFLRGKLFANLNDAAIPSKSMKFNIQLMRSRVSSTYYITHKRIWQHASGPESPLPSGVVPEAASARVLWSDRSNPIGTLLRLFSELWVDFTHVWLFAAEANGDGCLWDCSGCRASLGCCSRISE